MADVTKGHVILSPNTGTGDTQLTLKAESANVGNRKIVKSVFTITAAGVSPNKTITANFAAAPEFITLEQAGTGVTVPATAGKVTITGVSNSPKLGFSVEGGDIVEEDLGDKQFTADGSITATNGVAISGDPGADHKYEFSIEINYVLNDTVETRTQVIYYPRFIRICKTDINDYTECKCCKIGSFPSKDYSSTRRFGSQCTSYNQHDIYYILILCLSLSCVQKYVNSWGGNLKFCIYGYN